MKKILIFGATGNVGSYLTKYAIDFFKNDQYEIIAIGRRETNFFDKMGIKYYSVDISRKEEFEKLPKEDVFAVLLLAAEIPSYMSEYNPEKYVQSNAIGAFNVYEYCRKVKVDRILYTQTIFDIQLHFQDNKILKPNLSKSYSYKGDHAVYVITKNFAQDLLEHYHQEYGIKTFVFRLPTIYSYSPYKYYFPNGIKTKRPIYQLIEKAQKGETIEIWGDPKYTTDMVHVYDFSQMLCKAVLCDRNEGLYNVGSGYLVTLEDKIKNIIKVFSPKENQSKIVYRPDKKSGGGAIMDIENAKKELGYEPKYDCLSLLEDYKKEMKIDRFKELREGK